VATPATAPSAGAGELQRTLDPVGADRFLAEHWDRRPLLVPRDEPGRFRDLLSPEDVERLVCGSGLRAPAFRLVRDGAQIPLAGYTQDVPWRPGAFTQMAVVARVAEEVAAGATLVLQGLHLTWPAVARYCRALEQALACPVQANAYMTPASSQGFGVHHDTHDVFVLQVSGSKRWRIYEPVLELPLRDQRWTAALGDPGPPIEDLTLREGDTLYLPRGWPHEAMTGDAESLHLTVGLHPRTRLDALRAALDACADDVELRRALGPDGALPDDLLDRLAARLAPEDVAARARRALAATRRPILEDQLSQVAALASLGEDTPVERRPTAIVVHEAAAGRSVLVFDGKEVAFPAVAGAALAAVCAAEAPFTAETLPGPLDVAGRLTLVRRLVREGLLRQPALGS
jgi:ribosomal protein L16 Arg81 hydroxylase